MIKAFDIKAVYGHQYSEHGLRSLSSDNYENFYSKFIRHEYNRSHSQLEIDEYEKYTTTIYIDRNSLNINEPYMISMNKSYVSVSEHGNDHVLINLFIKK